jgi:hypothetical protein
MGKIIVENATVERVFPTQNGSWGVGVYETYTPKGSDAERKTRYTLWFKGDRPAVEQGQRVSASGFLSARVRSYEAEGENGPETRHTVDLAVNGARLIAAPEEQPPAPEPQQPETFEQAWQQPTERF